MALVVLIFIFFTKTSQIQKIIFLLDKYLGAFYRLVPSYYKLINAIQSFNFSISFKYIKKEKPDMLIVLGDRYEVFLLSFCSYLMGLKICHLHGGEITNGSFDEGLRHSISKFSNLHFVIHKKYRDRLINLGEKS